MPLKSRSEKISSLWLYSLHRSTFDILLGHVILSMYLRQLSINSCSLLMIDLVVFQVSQQQRRIDFTFVLNILILVLCFWRAGERPYRGVQECSKGMSCFADAQLNIFISSSCADVASQVYKLDHIFWGLPVSMPMIRLSAEEQQRNFRTYSPHLSTVWNANII